jgi:hypothetical protein
MGNGKAPTRIGTVKFSDEEALEEVECEFDDKQTI